ncbi:carboxy-terminal domain RNA polymerase II polypeptide A small phosphatase 1 [Jatropha curcas]|uniref:carboxy-terminal domain RNA polymerase II polypeptide A small phosphatase 1 n=1 Tax=Jatropha curcas TaxID=180498 RepID=UPI00189524DA|nr:carboxy-terminal domain RNA polymerase II polypeptide A small phosphatase 1 [Jatropha curcas]
MALIEQQGEVHMTRSVQIWRGIVNWLGFLLQLFLQILRITPSMAQMALSYVGFTYPLLSSSCCSSSSSFKSLPVVEIPLQESSLTLPAQISVPADVSEGDACNHRMEKLTVVLDLDETLVCAYETSSLPSSICALAIGAGLKWFELECVSPDKECEGKTKVNYVTVFERPGLREFLKQINEFADLVLFTAGLEGYARPLVDRIDVENRFKLRLYRPSTVSTEYREHVKDLSCIMKDLHRIVIVDNNPFSFLLQPLNGIPCVPFSADKPIQFSCCNTIME